MFSWSKCLEKNPLFGLFPFIYIIKTIFFIPTITVRIATEQLLISETPLYHYVDMVGLNYMIFYFFNKLYTSY